MADIAMVGAGIAGTACGLFLARRGHRVTLFERERELPSGDPGWDFLEQRRPRVPQAAQPHSFLAPVRDVLLAEAPEVYARMLELGARERHEFDWFDQHPPYRPGDERLVTVEARRIVLETALSEAAERQPGLERRVGDGVRGLTVDQDGSVPGVRGVVADSGEHRADLVLDAAGRRSPVPGWLVAAGCRPPAVESQRVGVDYYCRWYRHRQDGPPPPGRVLRGSVSPFAVGLVFPADGDVFALAVTASSSDPGRRALRDPAVFEAAARTFPATARWLALDPEPISGVRAMAGLDNRWTGLVDRLGPVATGLALVGDSASHTNPTQGQGVPHALWTARRLARTAATAVTDPVGFALAHHAWAVRTVKPWFDQQLTLDAANDARLRAAFAGSPGGSVSPGDPVDPVGPADPAAASPGPAQAVPPPMRCALEDPVVMRARSLVRHLIALPEAAYGTDEVRAAVARWLRGNPVSVPAQDGPDHATWTLLTAAGR
ncbi:NAD(P)/FAD-dependent oxidoreductase [Streptacidiphilus cavernicola]|uniref:NAD(P)/FAD-dependent oxidoreductase n=1 Tax=Streptacidiphilus cavernicola TaxID=3342716 RepID=A0ABV6VRT3_9ACTN